MGNYIFQPIPTIDFQNYHQKPFFAVDWGPRNFSRQDLPRRRRAIHGSSDLCTRHCLHVIILDKIWGMVSETLSIGLEYLAKSLFMIVNFGDEFEVSF